MSDINTDTGVILEALNDKADRNLYNLTSQAGAALNSVGVRTVVQTYKNGKSWYRVWSDGWIEQGGSYTTTGTYNFLKPFTDTNYCWTSGGFNNSAENVTYQRDAALDRTTTSFRVIAGQHSTWYACGY